MESNNSMAFTEIEMEVDYEEQELFVVLYRSMLYLLALFLAGDIVCGKFLRVIPPLVGHIAMGILLGPHALDVVPAVMTLAWPILGELGLVLMLCQAGLEMDLEVLQAVGPRGALMALVGSILPSTIGFLIAYFALNLTIESAVALGCSFVPTSAGIALNVLQPCGVLKTALGQLIVAISIVDDIIALVVLSQLQALTSSSSDDENDSGVSAASIAIPIVSAFLWLFAGGAVALYGMPKVLSQVTLVETKLLDSSSSSKDETKLEHTNTNTAIQSTNASPDEDNKSDERQQGRGCETSVDSSSTTPSSSFIDTLQFAHIIVLIFALLPATYYSKASHFLGAFLAGLSACQQPRAAKKYNQELDRIITWLLRIFFGASIAFVIPVQLFGDAKVIGTGFLLSLALLGKIITGPLLTPVELVQPPTNNDDEHENNTTNGATTKRRHRFDRQHVRDCLVVGFSMAGEAEFAMLIAGFGFSEGQLEEDVYASTVFAILLSTILSPCLLRLTLALFVVEDEDHNPQIYDAVQDDNDNSHDETPNGPHTTTANLNQDDHVLLENGNEIELVEVP